MTPSRYSTTLVIFLIIIIIIITVPFANAMEEMVKALKYFRRSNIPRGRVAAAPRLWRGYSVETPRLRFLGLAYS